MNVQQRVSLAPYTTFRIGGPARYFVEAQTTNDVIEALQFAEDNHCPYFILGGGSNLLFPDAGYDGIVIKMSLTGCVISGSTVSVEASVSLAKLIDMTLDSGLTGMEFAAGIPGEVGGAIRGNAGTFGVSMGDVVSEVTVVPVGATHPMTVPHDQCHFAYRHSAFKEMKAIIVSAKLQLLEGDITESRKLIHERIAQRQANHPHEPSAGCIFKNIELQSVDTSQLVSKGIDLEPFQKYQKIPTGFLIECLGLKGKTIGGAQVSPKHANYIINTGSATSEDIITLISLIKQQVRDAYGIQLEEEVHIVA